MGWIGRLFVLWCCVFFCLPASAFAQPSAPFGTAVTHLLESPTVPRYSVAVGHWNTDITPDAAIAPHHYGPSPVLHFMLTTGAAAATALGPAFPRTYTSNMFAGFERLVTIDVGPNGSDGRDDLVGITSTGALSLSLNAGSPLHNRSGLQAPIALSEISQVLPSLQMLNSDEGLFLPVAMSVLLPDGDNYPDLILGGMATNGNQNAESTGILVYRGVTNGLDPQPLEIATPNQAPGYTLNLIVDARFLDLDPAVPGPETLAVLEELAPPIPSSGQFSYSMSFFRWQNGTFVLQGTSHPYGPRHLITNAMGRLQAFDAADLNNDGLHDYVFAANAIYYGQPINRGDVVILWGNNTLAPSAPGWKRLESTIPQTLADLPGGQNLSAYASIRIRDVTGAWSWNGTAWTNPPEIVVLQEQVGNATTPFTNANVLVFEEGQSLNWTDAPTVTDIGGLYFRMNSHSAIASWTASMATPDALQFADLDCDEREEVVIGGVLVPTPTPSMPNMLTHALSVLPNMSAARPGAAKCVHRGSGSPLPIAPVLPSLPMTFGPAPQIAFDTSTPKVHPGQATSIGIRLSGTHPGTWAWVMIGDPLDPPVPIHPFGGTTNGFNLLLAPTNTSGMFLTQSQVGDPPRSAWARYPGYLLPNPSLVGMSASLQWVYYTPQFGLFGATHALDFTIGN